MPTMRAHRWNAVASASLVAAAAVVVEGRIDGFEQRVVLGSRRLEDANNNQYSYLDDVSGYSIRYGKCLRVKLPNNSDDDGGNQIFINGRYHAQYYQYASFVLCTDTGNECECDESVDYATDLDSYLESQTEYVQGYCNSCANTCGGGRRRTEDQGGEDAAGEDYNVNCNTCKNDCSTLWNSNGGADELDYLECQDSHEDENGLQYYSGPECDDNGELIIGLFYDDECTVRAHSELDNGFTYPAFQTVQQMCMSCGDGSCDDLYQGSAHCSRGRDMTGGGGDDDEPDVCRAYGRARTEHQYSERKKTRKTGLLVFFSLLFIGAFVFLSYTYFIRHKNKKVPLADLDNDMSSGQAQGGSGTAVLA